MKVFYLYFLFSLLFINLQAQVIQAINSTYPFRIGSHVITSVSSANTYTITFLVPLQVLPTLGVGFNAIDYQVSAMNAPLAIKMTTSSLTVSGFTLQSTITNPSNYKRVGYTYIAANPIWNIWKLYSGSYSSSGNLTNHTLTTASIGNQPLINLKGIMIRGLDVNYTYPHFPNHDPPYQFVMSITTTGVSSRKNMVKDVVDKLIYDLTLITFNGTLGIDEQNQDYGLKWGMNSFSVQETTYGTSKTETLLINQCVLFTNYGMYGISWFNRTHFSFRFQPDNENNINWIWQARSSTYYLNLTKFYFTVQKCTNQTYIYLMYRTQKCYTTCPTGYFDDNGTKKCQICTTPVNCSKCATATTCKTCNGAANIYLNQATGLCFFCTLANCTKCSSPTVCQTCQLSIEIYQYLGQCKLCTLSNCSKCSSPTICETCTISSGVFKYLDQCEVCTLINCTKCQSPNVCQTCDLSTVVYLYHGNCQVCTLVNCIKCTSPTTCQSCFISPTVFLNANTNLCETCNLANCIKCISLTQCQQCNSDPGIYLNPLTQQCEMCTLNNCNKCKTPTTCEVCDSAPNIFLYSDLCLICSIDNCTTCLTPIICQTCASSVDIFAFDGKCKTCTLPNCTKCLTPTICQICQISPFIQLDNNGFCHLCFLFPNCTKCATPTTCAICSNDYPLLLNTTSGQCYQCNPNSFDSDSIIPYCSSLIQCYLSNKYNQGKKACQVNEFVLKLIEGFNGLISLPTINLLSRIFVNLVGVLDNISYYSYHKRNYSRVIAQYFQMSTNFTLDRFYPPSIRNLLDKIDFSYAQLILQKDLNKTPDKFTIYDGTIHFLLNIESFLISTIPTSMLTFVLFSILDYLTNKWKKNRIFKRYRYTCMIIIDLLSGNLQYMSFRCFQQLYQSTPLAPIYYINCVSCYFMLLLILIYSITIVQVFKSFYQKVKNQFIYDELFEIQLCNWFIFLNLLKVFNGFIHSYFYDFGTIQSGLLVLSCGLKLISYFVVIQKIQGKLQIIFQLVSSTFMFIINLLFMAQMFFIRNEMYSQQIQTTGGGLQLVIGIIMLGAQVLAMLILPLKSSILTILQRFSRKKIDSKTCNEIKVKRNKNLHNFINVKNRSIRIKKQITQFESKFKSKQRQKIKTQNDKSKNQKLKTLQKGIKKVQKNNKNKDNSSTIIQVQNLSKRKNIEIKKYHSPFKHKTVKYLFQKDINQKNSRLFDDSGKVLQILDYEYDSIKTSNYEQSLNKVMNKKKFKSNYGISKYQRIDQTRN